jgi:hypothetical protein
VQKILGHDRLATTAIDLNFTDLREHNIVAPGAQPNCTLKQLRHSKEAVATEPKTP